MFAAVKHCLFRNLRVRESIRPFSVAVSSSTISPIAYGQSDFGMIRKEGSWYVDKTHFLPTLEAMGKRLFFVRPPRFGKTLLLSMMEHYYDVNNKNNFDELFGGLWIHQNPTKLRTSFHILPFNFSSISVDEKVESNFFDQVNRSVELCCKRYGLSAQNIIKEENALRSVLYLASEFEGKNFMILIDEYDRFANSLLFDDPQMYDKVVRGRSGDPASALTSFLTTLKAIPNRIPFLEFRSFITGIMPLNFAECSGYNVSQNITLHEYVGDLVGLKRNDIKAAIDQYLPLEPHQQTRVLHVMQSYYDGYYFPGCKEPLYNSTLVSYFLKKMFDPDPAFRNYILTSRSINPDDLQDPNTKVSDRVMSVISKVPSSADIVYRLSNEQVEASVMKIHKSFNLQPLHPPEDDVYAHDRALSFLFYHGVTTLKSGKIMFVQPVPLRVPNKLTKIGFIDRLKQVLSLPEKLLFNVEDDPNKETVHALLAAIIEKQQSLFDNNLSEGGLQHMIEAALCAQFRGRVGLGIEELVTAGKGDGRNDVRIKFGGKIVVIELKRVRLNALFPPPELKAGHPPIKKATNWHPRHQEKFINYLKEHTNDVLYKYEICSDFYWMYKAKSVSEMLGKGCCQVKKYMTQISKENPNNTCYAFVAVQVGFPLIVEQVH